MRYDRKLLLRLLLEKNEDGSYKYSHRQVAKIVGCSRGNVWTHIINNGEKYYRPKPPSKICPTCGSKIKEGNNAIQRSRETEGISEEVGQSPQTETHGGQEVC